jgi:hypothetical protein
MVTVFITYRLKPGVTREEYDAWSVNIDQPTASRQPGVHRYEIFAVDEGDETSWDYVEVIDADSREAWEKVNGYPEMQPVAARFFELCDRDSVRVVYSRKV